MSNIFFSSLVTVTVTTTATRIMTVPKDIVELTLSFLPEYDERFAKIYQFCFYTTTADNVYFPTTNSCNLVHLLSINTAVGILEVKITVGNRWLLSQQVRDVEYFHLQKNASIEAYVMIQPPKYSLLRWMPYTKKIYTLAEYLYFGINKGLNDKSPSNPNWIVEYRAQFKKTSPSVPTNVLDPIRKILSEFKIPQRSGAPGSRKNPWIEFQPKTNAERSYKKGVYFMKNTGRHTHRGKLLVWDGRTGKLASGV